MTDQGKEEQCPQEIIKQVVGKRGKTGQEGSETSKPKTRAQAEEEDEQVLKSYELERIIESYDQAIKDYEMFYQREMNSNCEGFYGEQLVDEYEQMLTDCENNVQSTEDIIYDFQQSYEYIKQLKGKEREEYTEAWKDYLKDTLGKSKKLIDSIKNRIALLTE